MLVFQEHLPSGALGVVRMLAFAAVVVGAALLARGDTPIPDSSVTTPRRQDAARPQTR